MTHRCDPYRIEYGDTRVRCLDCGRTWLRRPHRWQLINAGKADENAERAGQRKAATWE